MADDTQFDPFAGILTPQMLQMQRLQQMQQLYQQAGAQAPNGQQFGARSVGLALGQAVGGGGAPGPLDQLAQQNQQILSSPSGNDGTPPVSGDPYEDRARQYEQLAAKFKQQGMYQQAAQFMSEAQIVRKQSLDAQKTQAETFEAGAKGQDALAHTWSEPKEGVNPSTGKLQNYQAGPDGVVRWLGADGKPQVPMANVTVNMADKFLGPFAGQIDKYKVQADDAAASLGMIRDLRSKLDSGVITGTGADQRTQFGTLLQTLGFNKGGNNPVANSQAFAAETLQMALLNRPAGQRLTQSEWNALKSMAGGDTNLTESGIREIIKVRQMVAESTINKYNGFARTLSKTAASTKDEGMRSGLQMGTQLYPEMAIPDSSPVVNDPALDAALRKYLPAK